MPELRQNLATKEWVIIATERAKRPHEFIQPAAGQWPIELEPPYEAHCPFCVGNEELDLEIERLPETGPWQTRVVHNKYPVLSKDGEPDRVFDGVNRWIAGVGHHEIVIDHPRHNTTWALMTPAEIAAVLQTFYNRGWNLVEDARVEQIIYFKNHGARAGASLKHPHCQIIALPIVPNEIRKRNEDARRYFDDQGQCVYQAIVTDELKKKERLVAVSDHFAAFVLYAAPSPFHIWVIPRRQSESFLYTRPEEIDDLAGVLYDIFRRLYIGLGDPSYNLIIRSAPVKEIGSGYLQWYVTIVPRLFQTAGFEMGSGVFINSTLPEESAAFLRGIKM